ncbi:hypothetical protein CPB85DRAFT_644142 [Mucidula mucida]|nr:hypothetical protein CPB85DRAFT_644142 [Mucidula mucida]
MTDSCATWRNQTSHSGFTGCKCDGKDITGRSAHQDCAETAALMAFIIGPPILIVALICYTREAQERLETFLIRCLEDTVICHPRIQPLRFAIKWTRPSAPIAQHPIRPRELCDIIIGFCEEDQSLLLSCILVCVAWVSPSRKRLKMELRCKSYKHIVELTHLLRSPVETRPLYWYQLWREVLSSAVAIAMPSQIEGRSSSESDHLAPHLIRLYLDLQSLTFHAISCSANPDGGLNPFPRLTSCARSSLPSRTSSICGLLRSRQKEDISFPTPLVVQPRKVNRSLACP